MPQSCESGSPRAIVRVSEIWESRVKLDAFGEKLRPRLEEAGIQLAGEPEAFEAHVVDTF
jgi:hypothetical protein